MRILRRYLVVQLVGPFCFALAALTSLLLLNQIAQKLGDLLGKGLPWTVFAEFFLLTIPHIVVLTISMAVLVAVLYTFTRLAGDSEITAFWAGGVSLARLVRPALGAATVVAVAAFLFGDQVMSRTNHRLRVLWTDIQRTKPTLSLKEHFINEIQKGRLALWAGHIDQATYLMHDVAIYDLADVSRIRVIYADSGRVAFAPNQEDLQLTLFDGSTHDFDGSHFRELQQTFFPRNLLLVKDVGSEFLRREGDSYRGDREMSVCDLEGVALTARREVHEAASNAEVAELNGLRALVGLPPVEGDSVIPDRRRSLYCRALGAVASRLVPPEMRADGPQASGSRIPQQDSVTDRVVGRFNARSRPTLVRGASVRAWTDEARTFRDREHSARVRAAVYLVEFHKKYAIPAACIVFVLVGIPVALRFPGSGVGLVIGVSMAVFGVYYVGLIAGESLANRLAVSPFWAMWGPNVVFCIVGTIALWRSGRHGIAGRGRNGLTARFIRPAGGVAVGSPPAPPS